MEKDDESIEDSYDDSSDEQEEDEDSIEDTLTLMKHQVKHFRKISKILEKDISYLDTSEMGTGKTVIAMALCLTLDLDLFVICNKSNIPHWRRHCRKYGVKLVDILNYEKLRGTRDSDLKHPYLKKFAQIGKKHPKYVATKAFREIAASGTLFIFDESQKTKNDNLQLRSCHALVREVVAVSKRGYKEGPRSKIGILSATPGEDRSHASSLLKMLGIITKDELYSYDHASKVYHLEGLKQAIDYCSKIDHKVTVYFRCQKINKTTIPNIALQLFNKVVRKTRASRMPKLKKKFDLDCKNLYGIMNEEDTELLARGISNLSRATNYNSSKQEVQIDQNSFGAITSCLIEIEKAKYNMAIRHGKRILDTTKKGKVVLFFNYKENIYRAKKMFKSLGYRVLVLTGDREFQKPEIRQQIIDRFNRRDTKYRILLTNKEVGGNGVDLDDVDGSFPRYVFMSPDYKIGPMHQATGRFYRTNTKSLSGKDIYIRVLYSINYHYENSILRALARKTRYAKQLHGNAFDGDEKKDIIMPGEYFIEAEVEEGKFIDEFHITEDDCTKYPLLYKLVLFVNDFREKIEKEKTENEEVNI